MSTQNIIKTLLHSAKEIWLVFFPDKTDPHRPDSVKSEYYTDFEMLLERQSSLNYINNFDIRLSLC